MASVQLAWLTYYGAALAALKRGHLGFAGFFLALPQRIRSVAFVLAEFFVISFFLAIGWAGWYLLSVFGYKSPFKGKFTDAIATVEGGCYSLETMQTALDLVLEGKTDAICYAPLNKEAMHLAGMTESDEMSWCANSHYNAGPRYRI